MRPGSIFAALGAVLVLAIAIPVAIDAVDVPKPQISCMTSAGGEPRYGILVVGESWASGDRLYPDLPAVLASRTGVPVRACTMGFSGKNTRKIDRGIKRELAKASVSSLFGGRAPDNVIVLNGVNDQIQHVGATTYADETADVAAQFPGSKVQVVTLPRIHFDGRSLNILLRWKAFVQRFAFDHGNTDPSPEYRAALAQRHPETQTIDFDGFMPQYDSAKYRTDGIHLTAEEFRLYGAFLAKNVVLSGR